MVMDLASFALSFLQLKNILPTLVSIYMKLFLMNTMLPAAISFVAEQKARFSSFPAKREWEFSFAYMHGSEQYKINNW